MESEGTETPGPVEAPARRRVVREMATADAAGRRGCMLVGALLGVGIGALVALFVVPPLLNHYFGTADVELGKTYEGDAKRMTVREVRTVPPPEGATSSGTLEVVMDVTTNKTWAPAPADFEVELSTGGERLALLPPDPSRPETSLTVTHAEPRTLVLRFAASTRRDALPETLHVAEPRVRFHLQPGKPE